jgi:hypothetical protein
MASPGIMLPHYHHQHRFGQFWSCNFVPIHNPHKGIVTWLVGWLVRRERERESDWGVWEWIALCSASRGHCSRPLKEWRSTNQSSKGKRHKIRRREKKRKMSQSIKKKVGLVGTSNLVGKMIIDVSLASVSWKNILKKIADFFSKCSTPFEQLHSRLPYLQRTSGGV